MTTVRLPFVGKRTADVLLVVDPPIGGSYTEDRSIPLRKNHGDYLKEQLRQAGFNTSNVCVLSAAPVIPFQDYKKQKVLSEHLKQYRELFLQTVNDIDPKLIVVFGNNAARQVYGRAVQITKIRGLGKREESVGNRIVFPTLSLSHVFFKTELESIFNSDIRSAKRIEDNNYKLAKKQLRKTKYSWIKDIKFLLNDPPKWLCVDVETTGGQYYHKGAKLLTVQLCCEAGVAYSIPLDYDHPELDKSLRLTMKEKVNVIRQLKKLLGNKKVRCFGHHLKYDWLFLKSRFGVEIANYYNDTLLMVHTIDENIQNKNLDDSVKLFVPEMAGFNDELNRDPDHQGKTRMDLLPPDKMLQYGCGDTDANFQLHRVLRKKIREDKASFNAYRRITMPAVRAFCDIEREGFHIDVDQLRRFEKKLAKHQIKLHKRIVKQIPESILSKYRDTGKGISLTRDAILRDFLFIHPDGLNLEPLSYTKSSSDDNPIPSVSSKTHLPYFNDIAVVNDIIEYKKNSKLLSTYVAGFYKYIHDGKVRPSYKLHGTKTHRTASSDPNGQNFPKRGDLAKEYRKIFIAPPGYCYLEVDYSQAELRITAIASGDKRMLKVYNTGGDIHTTTAAYVMGIGVDQFLKLADSIRSKKRFQAKAINFGFIYGMWWKKFRVYAKTEYGIDFTEREAQDIRNAFFNLYKALEPWHHAVIDFVNKHGYVRAFSGTVRHLPNIFSRDESTRKEAQRQAINSPIQCFANQLGLMALARINDEIPKEEIRLCGFVHDAIIGLVPEGIAVQTARKVIKYMESNPLEEWFGFKSPIPITADASIGYNLSEMTELNSAVLKDSNIISYRQVNDEREKKRIALIEEVSETIKPRKVKRIKRR